MARYSLRRALEYYFFRRQDLRREPAIDPSQVLDWAGLFTGAYAPVVAYSTKRLNPASVNFASVRRSSQATGTETDVAWAADNTPNVALLAKLGSTTQVGQVIYWRDQSGNAFDAPIPTFDTAGYNAAPEIFASSRDRNGVAPILFDNDPNTTAFNKRLLIPNGASLTNNNCTFFVVRRRMNTTANNTTEFVFGAAGATRIGVRSATGAIAAIVGAASVTLSPTNYAPTRWECAAYIFNGSNLTVTDSNGTRTSAITITSATSVGGTICDSAGTTPVVCEHAAFIAIPAALSSDDVAARRAALLAYFGEETAPPTKRIIHVGDSRTQGTGSSYCLSFPRQLDDLLTVPAQSYNMGIYGEQLVAVTLGKYSGQVAGRFTPGSVVVLQEGYNDITAGAKTGLQVYNAFVSYAQAARATGYKFIACTLMPGTMTAPQQTECADLNTRLRANTTDFDGLADLAANANLGVTSGWSSTYWNSDNIHLKNAGNALMAGIVAPIANALLA